MRACIVLALCAVACAPDQWRSMQTDWPEPDPDKPPRDLVREEDKPAADEPKLDLPPDNGPLSLSIEQATILALQNNRDLAVQQLDPVIAGAFELIERGVFDPEVYADLAYGEETSSEVSRSTGERFDVDAEDVAAGVGVRQRLPTGTDIDIGLTNERDTSNRAPTQEQVRLGLTVTQSLLRGLGPRVNLARVQQAAIGTEASKFELEGFTQAVIADTQIAYWNYVLAKQEIAIFQRSLEVAVQQRDELQTRIDVGTLPEDQIAVARTEVAVRELALIDARARLEERRLRLLRQMSPDLDGGLDRPIDSTSEPKIEAPIKVEDDNERVQLALKARPDLQEARLRQEQNRLETVVTRNGILPRLDLFVTLGKSGYADTLIDAFKDLDGDNYDARVGISLSAFLENRSARGRDLAARASWRRSAEAVENLAQIVRLDVRLALNELERARQQITATRTTRELQELTVAAELQRFEVGASTGLLVAQAQRDLLQVQIDEVRAVVAYRIALVQLYLAEGSLLPRRGLAVR
ncbi:MAG: TolC family protein [Planctomycetota bacterium]